VITEVRAVPGGSKFTVRSFGIRLFFSCWLVYCIHFATNIVREIYPALTLGDHFSFNVFEYKDLHPFDIFEIPGRGAFINNNPGASILGAIPYTLTRPVIDRIVKHVQKSRAASPEPIREYNTKYPLTQEFYNRARAGGLDIKLGLAAGVIQALLMAPLSALSAVVMFYILLHLTSSIRGALLLALLYAFATPVFYRTAQLNQNLLVGHCAFFVFALVWRPWEDRVHLKPSHYLAAGLLCGWAVVLDYSGLIVLGVLGLYTFARRSALPPNQKSRADLFCFAAGVLLALSVLLFYQWQCFGSPFYSAQHYMPPTQYTRYGYRGIDWPHLDLLWETAFGMRYGLFSSAPLLLLWVYVPGWIRHRPRLFGLGELGCIIIFSAAFFLFCAMNQYGRVQFNTGVRYIVPVAPFLFLLTVSVLLRMPTVLAGAIAVVCTYWSWSLSMYRDVEQGLGVLEAPIHVALEGLRLPWLDTLEKMGYVRPGIWEVPLMGFAGMIVVTLWSGHKWMRKLRS